MNTGSPRGRIVTILLIGLFVASSALVADLMIRRTIEGAGESARDEPTENGLFAAFAKTRGFTEANAVERERLAALLRPFAASMRASAGPESVFLREDAQHTLWLFGFPAKILSMGSADQQNVLHDIPAAGVLVEDKRGLNWPVWSASADGVTGTVPANLPASDGWRGFFMTMQNSLLLGCWPILGFNERLMKAEAQRILDIANQVSSTAPPLPTFTASTSP